jgi:hypothetical protein
MARGREEVLDELAEVGSDMVVAQLMRVIRQPTPYYWTRISHRREYADRVVHDAGIVYGPWLEGVSERNRSTRFKGYHTFRIISRQLQSQAGAIADMVIADRVIPRLDGA